MQYTGTIIEESLKDKSIIDNLDIISSRVSSDGEWHLHKITISEQGIEKLKDNLKPEKWYAHFWNSDDVIAVFPGKIFTFKHSQKDTWRDAVGYGKSLHIPEEQLDFLIE